MVWSARVTTQHGPSRVLRDIGKPRLFTIFINVQVVNVCWCSMDYFA